MTTALATMAAVTEPQDGARYRVAVWQNRARPLDEPLVFGVESPGMAAEAVLWLVGDPSVMQIITTDTATGRQLTVWTR